MNAIKAGIITKSTKDTLTKLEEEQENIQISLAREQIIHPILSREQIEFWIMQFATTDITNEEQKQRLIDIFINSVYVYDDRLLVFLNYKDGERCITFDEVECIKKAQAIAEEAFEYILTFIKPGVTEKQIALELDFYMLSHGAEALSFETIAVTGKKTSMPHGVPDDTVVESGDFITMDFGAVYKGYHSDMTRTVAVGSVSDEQRKIYENVLQAQKSALSLLRAGEACQKADAAARDIISNAGYGKFFGHGTGHGVGVEIHEEPNLSPNYESPLKVGNVVTVEPGIYLPGKFGVRIEDMALITEDGYENLTKTPKELIVIEL